MSDLQSIRLLLADVDGTLVTNDKVLTEAAQAAARDLYQAGIMLAITSGRPPRGMAMLIGPLALKGAIAGFNGGVYVNPYLTVIESHPLDPATALMALNLVTGQKLSPWIYTDKEWLVLDAKGPHVEHEAWTVKFDARMVTSFTEAQLANAIKIVGVSDDFALVAQSEQLAQTALGERASAHRSQPYYLDITDRKANKGAVVTRLSKMLGIPANAIATIGDQPNDVLMFKQSGLSIAMGNASPEVQAAATAVTATNAAEGFARAVEQFILPRAPTAHPEGDKR